MSKDLFTDKEKKYEPSASDLRDEFIINDPAEYVGEFRKFFLKWVRETKGLSKSIVCSKCHVSTNELDRVEKGNISEKDMMFLNKLADIYGLSYPYLLALFKLARRPQKFSAVKLAAYHATDIDEATQNKIVEFISKLKGSQQ